MQYQPFVPLVAQKYFDALLYGEGIEPVGLVHIHAQLVNLTKLENAQARKFRELMLAEGMPPDVAKMAEDAIASIRPNFQDSGKREATRIDCIRRLGEDPRMETVYALLKKEFSRDDEWERFLFSAWSAARDYSASRVEGKKAKELAAKISSNAKSLANLIKDFQKLSLENKPHHFFSVRHLLCDTENEYSMRHNEERWKGLKSIILGQSFSSDEPSTETHGPESYPDILMAIEYEQQISAEVKSIENDHGDDEAATHSAWRSAPFLPALLDTLSATAADYRPEQDEVTEAAIASRKSTIKTHYIRGIGKLLTQDDMISLTKNVKKAIAVAANVVLNDPDFDTSYDDVSKALRTVGT